MYQLLAVVAELSLRCCSHFQDAQLLTMRGKAIWQEANAASVLHAGTWEGGTGRAEQVFNECAGHSNKDT